MSDEHDELLMLYEASGRDSWEVKRQQWNVTYYALLVYAALIGFYKTVQVTLPVGQFVIVGLAVLMTFYGFWFLASSQLSLVAYRKTALAIERRFSESFRNCLGPDEPGRITPYKDFSFLLGKMIAMSAGALSVCWAVYSNFFYLVLAGLLLLIGFVVSIGYLQLRAEKVGPDIGATTQHD